MVELRLQQIAEKTNGKILQGSPSLTFQKFNIDSRLTNPGELFFAIHGNRNGHDFIPDAINKGAQGAVISQEMHFPESNFALIYVKDSLQALHDLAKSILAETNIKVVGITGSIGKTTTKEFTSSLLSQKFSVLKSEGNFNNHLGLPLSLLRLNKAHEIAILEMGMSHSGEIKVLTQIAPPDIAVITNIHPVHLEFFNSIEEIALAKKEILDGLKRNGSAVLNADDPHIQKIAKGLDREIIYYGFSEKCDIRAQNITQSGTKGLSFDLIQGQKVKKLFLPFIYDSYLSNFLAGAAVARALKVPFEDIPSLIKNIKPFSMRGEFFHLKGNIRLIDDSYNSSPVALEAALKSLSKIPAQRKVAVLGDMLELGQKEADYHIHAGKQVKKWGWDVLVTVGPLSISLVEGAISQGMNENNIYSFKNAEEAAAEIISLIKEGDLILVKASRGIKTEKIVNALKKERA